ncbi:hypothetical protein HELRODRAFT_173299 [Helobdella robusta]|uniref:Methyltransferase FkbM domain-containing protein n=1 Tax=Helobdella robusta TaxID=6412 RepID=T1F6N4_HELRO|nr:hypothetical protein HELRODRAFT_173299 [Helobdella robusta]ESO03608.1 hypothetical protein HELRODRAFT_173299 [Helobdella robusta]
MAPTGVLLDFAKEFEATSIHAETSKLENDILIKIYDFKNQTTDKTLNCVETKLQPSFFVCVYPIDKDVFISKDLVLKKNPTSIFLDIGANIGYYTLLAAKLGHPVLAVEPTTDHLTRIHRALELENLTDNVVLLQNALAVKRELVNIYVSKTNQGDNRVVPKNSGEKDRPSNSHDLSSVTVNSLLLDDLISVLTSNFSSSQSLKSTPLVMKVDIQAMESSVLVTGDYFFDNTNVILVMMEWEPVIGPNCE